ncbi:SERTA domain-containing protein 2-like [Petromyzon marinus]|uniref:SERTA domain-containing protein 2-like n=1 Tax=Petromyzon marinus TaxID=7757 RepID=UPI003F72AE95
MFGKGVKRKLTEEDAVGTAGGLLLLPGGSGAAPSRCPPLPCAAPGPGRAYALQRQTVMSLSLGKLQEVRGQVEPCLRRYVAVTNTLRRIQEELRQEGVSRPLLPPWVGAGVGAQGPPPDRSCAETPPHSPGRGVAGSPSFALLPPSSSTLPLLLPPAVDLRSEAGGPEGSLCAISKLCHDDDEDDGDDDDGRGGDAGAPPRAEPAGRTRCACSAGTAPTRGDARPPAAACGCARRDASAETEPSERAAGPPAPGPTGRSPPDARAPPVPEMPFGGGGAGGAGCLDGTATAFLLPELSLDDVFTDVDTAMYDFDLFAPTALASGRGAGPAAGDEWPRGGVPAPCSSATGGSPQFKADLSELDHIMEVLVGS